MWAACRGIITCRGSGRTVEPDAGAQTPDNGRAGGQHREDEQSQHHPPGGLADARGGRLGQDRVLAAGAVR